MAKQIYIDLERGDLLQSFETGRKTSLTNILGILSGIDADIELFGVGRNDDGKLSPSSLTGITPTLKIDSPQRPSSGTFTATFGGDTTEEIDLTDSIYQVQCSLNDLAAVETAGGVTCFSSSNTARQNKGSFFIQWNEFGNHGAITLTDKGVFPKSTLTVENLVTGSSTVKQLDAIRIDVARLASVASWSATDEPAVTVSLVTEGDASTKEVQRLTIDPRPSGGVYRLQVDTGMVTRDISVFATANEIRTALRDAAETDIISVVPVNDFTFDIQWSNFGDKPLITVYSDEIVGVPGLSGTLAWNTDILNTLLSIQSRILSNAELILTDTASGNILFRTLETVRVQKALS